MANSRPWVLSVFRHLLERSDIKQKRRCSICRVPPHIRKVKPDRYDCTVLPLGLYNRNFRNFTPMDDLKLEVLSVMLRHMNLLESSEWNTFCDEITRSPPDTTPLEDFFDNPPNESFITPEVIRSVLAIDAVFITGLLHYHRFFVGHFLVEHMEAFEGELENIFSRTSVDVNAFLDEMFTNGRKTRLTTFPGRRRTFPTLTQLQKAGIHVRGCTLSIGDIHIVKSSLNLNATLYLPELIFHGKSEMILMNLWVYDLMSFHTKKVCAFMLVMDDLINTDDDVKLLRNGDEPVIVQNLLGSDEILAKTLFNCLLSNFVMQKSDLDHFGGVIDDIQTSYGTPLRHQLTHFIERFVTAPWILVTMITAALLLVATILQTVYTLLSFYHT